MRPGCPSSQVICLLVGRIQTINKETDTSPESFQAGLSKIKNQARGRVGGWESGRGALVDRIVKEGTFKEVRVLLRLSDLKISWQSSSKFKSPGVKT